MLQAWLLTSTSRSNREVNAARARSQAPGAQTDADDPGARVIRQPGREQGDVGRLLLGERGRLGEVVGVSGVADPSTVGAQCDDAALGEAHGRGSRYAVGPLRVVRERHEHHSRRRGGAAGRLGQDGGQAAGADVDQRVPDSPARLIGGVEDTYRRPVRSVRGGVRGLGGPRRARARSSAARRGRSSARARRACPPRRVRP